jgi:hypothetical protein
VTEIHEGDTLSVPCPDCAGELQADKRFELWSRTLGEPDMVTPFWSTTCAACGHRFNYSPGTGEIRRFEP